MRGDTGWGWGGGLTSSRILFTVSPFCGRTGNTQLFTKGFIKIIIMQIYHQSERWKRRFMFSDDASRPSHKQQARFSFERYLVPALDNWPWLIVGLYSASQLFSPAVDPHSAAPTNTRRRKKKTPRCIFKVGLSKDTSANFVCLGLIGRPHRPPLSDC